MSRKPVVCFVTLVLSQYRISFHRQVRDLLAAQGIEYRLVYSDPTGEAAAKSDTADLDWAIRVPVSSFRAAGVRFYWQSALAHVRNADLTIVSQENKLLLNYVVQARHLLFGRKCAFFGHGKTLTTGHTSWLAKWLKRFLATRVGWWFAYTPEVAELVASYGFPRERISINYNSIDTRTLTEELASISKEEVEAFRRRHGIRGVRTGLYLGALYPEKRLDFLIETARLVRERVPDFELVIVGAGPDAPIAQKAAAEHDFVHYLGALFGRDKAVALKASRACLLPGLVGLAILDTFAAACPLIATTAPAQGPEFRYLKDGRNGILVRDCDSVEAYAQAVAAVMTDDAMWHRLQDGGRESAQFYSIENMATHFTDGVVKAIAGRARRSRPGQTEESLSDYSAMPHT